MEKAESKKSVMILHSDYSPSAYFSFYCKKVNRKSELMHLVEKVILMQSVVPYAHESLGGHMKSLEKSVSI